MPRSFLAFLCGFLLLPLCGGCFLLKKPSKGNIDLRKKNQDLEARVTDLERQATGDQAMVRSLQEQRGTLPTLPRDRLARLFTTHDLKLGRLTGGADIDPSKPGQEGLRVYLTPLDETGDAIKAAGSITVVAFDLSRDKGEKIGIWTVDAVAARETWSSVLNRYNYVLTLPWQTPPSGTNVHIEVTFVDELTQARYTKSVDATVEPPARTETAPTSAPAVGK